MRVGWIVPPLWKGDRVFVIAGGQSVPQTFLRTTQLQGRVIAIKDAAFLKPDADIFFYVERLFHRTRPDVWAAYHGPPGTAGLRIKRTVHEEAPADVLQVRRSSADHNGVNGLQTDPALLGGFCAGGSALNLAYHLGAREIILIGYDLHGQHWNPNHPLPRARSDVHMRHRRSIDAMAAPLAAAGVKVYNTSPLSSLTEYPYAHLADLVGPHQP